MRTLEISVYLKQITTNPNWAGFGRDNKPNKENTDEKLDESLEGLEADFEVLENRETLELIKDIETEENEYEINSLEQDPIENILLEEKADIEFLLNSIEPFDIEPEEPFENINDFKVELFENEIDLG